MSEKLQYFSLQSSQNKRDSIMEGLKEAISQFQKQSFFQTQKIIQQMSKLNPKAQQVVALFPLLLANAKDAWKMTAWAIREGNSCFNNKTIFMIALSLIVLQEDRPIENSYKYSSKYFQKKYIMLQKLLATELSDFQQLLEQIKQKISQEQLRQLFRQVGQALTHIDCNLGIRCYYLYYQADLSNESKFLLGKALLEAGDADRGINYLSQIDYQNYDLEGLAMVARAYSQLNNLRQCVKAYLRILQVDSKSTAFSTLAHFQIAAVFERLLLHRQAVRRFRLSIAANQRRNAEEEQLFWKAVLKIALVYAYNQDFNTSIRILEKMVDQESIPPAYEIEACYLLAKNLRLVGNYEKCLYYYHKIEKMEASSKCLLKISEVCIILEKYSAAHQYLNKLLEHGEGKSKAWTYLSFVSLKQGQIEAAQTQLSNAEKIDKNQTVINQYYPQIIEGIYGKNDTSKGMLESVSSQRLALALSLELKASQSRRALQCHYSLFYLQQSLRYNNQGRISILFQIGMNLVISQRLTEALPYFQKVLDFDQCHQQTLEIMLHIYHYLKWPQETMSCFKKIEAVNYQMAARLFPLISDQNQQKLAKNGNKKGYRDDVDGFDMIILPAAPFKIKDYVEKLQKAITEMLMNQKAKAFEAFANIFKAIFDEPSKLYDCAAILAHSNLLQFAALFGKRYFTLLPFDKEGLKNYMRIVGQKHNVAQSDLNHIAFLMQAENTDGDAYLRMAKLCLEAKDSRRALNYSISAVKAEIRDEHYLFLEKLMLRCDYKEKRCLEKLNTFRSDNWKVHERLAKIYRREDQTDLEVYHLEQVMRHSWNRQKCLMRLHDIFKGRSPERYLAYVRELAEIQTTNTDLLLELAQLQGSCTRAQCQPQAYDERHLAIEFQVLSL